MLRHICLLILFWISDHYERNFPFSEAGVKFLGLFTCTGTAYIGIQWGLHHFGATYWVRAFAETAWCGLGLGALVTFAITWRKRVKMNRPTFTLRETVGFIGQTTIAAAMLMAVSVGVAWASYMPLSSAGFEIDKPSHMVGLFIAALATGTAAASWTAKKHVSAVETS